MFDLIGGSGFGAFIAVALSIKSVLNEEKTRYSPQELIKKFLGQNILNKIFKEKYDLASIYSDS